MVGVDRFARIPDAHRARETRKPRVMIRESFPWAPGTVSQATGYARRPAKRPAGTGGTLPQGPGGSESGASEGRRGNSEGRRPKHRMAAEKPLRPFTES